MPMPLGPISLLTTGQMVALARANLRYLDASSAHAALWRSILAKTAYSTWPNLLNNPEKREILDAIESGEYPNIVG